MTTEEIQEEIPQKKQEVSLDLTELPGIGKITAEKLIALGITDIKVLAFAPIGELGEILKNMDNASEMVISANMYLMESGVLEKPFTTALELYKSELNRERLSTQSKELDKVLGGGIERKSVTEFYGEFGSGKSQICFTLSVLAAQTKEKGGFDSGVLYIDTENTFSPERLDEICKERGLDPDFTLGRIMKLKASAAPLLIWYINRLPEIIKKHPVKLIVIDSIIALHRAEMRGRGTLADKQQQLSGLMHQLVKVADLYDVAVVITNQVVASPDPFTAAIRATGGNVISHGSTHRIYLRKSGKHTVAKMVDSPRYPAIEGSIDLVPSGIEDFSSK